MNKSFVFALILIFSISSVFAANFPRYNYENKYVTDTVGVLSSADVSRITSLCASIEQNTTAQIAVVIIDTTGELSIEDYAIQLFEHWKIGTEKNDNGLLILVAISDQKYRIEVGYGLEGVLNDAKVGRVARNYFVDNFKAGTYGEGIYSAIEVMGLEIEGEETPITYAREPGAIELIVLIAFLALPFVVFILIVSDKSKDRRRSRFLYWILFSMIFSMFGRGRGGFGGGRSGGGFGGFGGGRSGGGGASGGW